jgi:hypothetical protein
VFLTLKMDFWTTRVLLFKKPIDQVFFLNFFYIKIQSTNRKKKKLI